MKEVLSFTKVDMDNWNDSETNEYVKSITHLNKILNLLLEHTVNESEKIYRPLHGRELTSDERLFGFIKFWTEVKYNFAFFDQVPELDWDKVLIDFIPRVQINQDNTSYYKLLSEICALLNDGHTNIYPPSDLSKRTANLPLELKEFEDGIFLTNFGINSNSELEIGMKLISIDDIAVNDLVEKEMSFISASTDYIKRRNAIAQILEGIKGTDAELQFQNLKDSIININLKRTNNIDWHRKKPYNGLTYFTKKDNIGILEINSFGNSKVVERFESHLSELVSIDNLVIDLRNNGGGNSGYGYQILDYFSSQAIITSKWKTKEHKPAYMAWGKSITGNIEALTEWESEALRTYQGDYWYESPPDTIESTNDNLKDLNTVILIGNNTASAAEDFLIAAESLLL